MRYEVTCLTPTLVGDGQRLSPIDYMVWKDHVNVLDQRRIFKLLARGPRLEGYLTQLRKAEKLDFASWGGFAQNYAGRRIPFEHPSVAPAWERTRAEHLFIPTFASGPSGAYLPATALKGALRTGAVHARWNERTMAEVAQKAASGDLRGLRRAGPAAEEAALGSGGANVMRLLGASDSEPVGPSAFRVYLLRVATLEPRGGKQEPAWKTSPRGSTPRADDATSTFAEMTQPETKFSGVWSENAFLLRPEIAQAGRRRGGVDRKDLFASANQYASDLLRLHRQYAETARLTQVLHTVEGLERELEKARSGNGQTCLLNIGWGGGFLSKTAFLDTAQEDSRAVLRQLPFFARAIQSGLPFPKTRRIVFEGGLPSSLPGWVRLQVQ